jgi:hypothetical protein
MGDMGDVWVSYGHGDMQVSCDYMIDSNRWQCMATEDIKAGTQMYHLSNDKQ